MATKIAIIEDDQAISQMYRIKFEAAGFEVRSASNGSLGLDIIKETQPDIVLLDLMMPEMDGHEMLKLLRSTDWGKRIKVVVMTNVGEDEIAESIEGLDVSGLLIKAQTTPAQVVERVKQLLSI